MKNVLLISFFFFTSIVIAQDISMQDGTFDRCAPDRFFDSGGEFGNYGNDENFTTTICPQNAGETIILDFTAFSTQLNTDIMTIYDGDSTTATVLGTFSGVAGPGTVAATPVLNASGCITIEFVSNGSGNTTGWEAEILCAVPCQDINTSIDSTNPAPNNSGVISILPGETVDFTGSAAFSVDGTNATYEWNFGDGNTASGTSVSNTFANDGTYTVTLTVTDDNPTGCSRSATITVFVLGPNVVVDQDTYTPEELIEEVLINSPCAEVSNIVWSTGTSFSAVEPNGIGYFIGDGTAFPFEDGLILTSGNASEARGPNDIAMSAGSGAWPGDTDLNNAVGIVSNNASFIQFDFTPLADSISFDFIMASEEYDGNTGGTFECTFSDAFAFLLTDPGGNTTNLAVLPGTNTPILVTNIHPANPGCPAVNEQFFGGYTPLNGPPISFNGRTTVFTAQANVVPGDQYTIKLVVADATDTALDSGVFLRAGSFDLGGDLGDDITIAAGTAECGGSTITLDTSAPTATHIWYFNGVEINGETGSTLDITEAGEYSVDVIFSGVCQASDSIIVEFRSNPVANDAPDLVICDVDGTAEFMLTDNDDDVLGTQDPTQFVVSYHLTEQDAIDNVGALTSPYTNTSSPQTIYARIADNSQFCFDTTSFDLQFSSLDINNNITPIQICDDLVADGFTSFDLSIRDTEVIGGNDPNDVNVTYHISQADAEAGVNPLPTNYTNISNPQTIFIRLEIAAVPDCYNVTTLDLDVLDSPVAIAPTPFEVCDDAPNDGFAQFDLSTKNLEIIGIQTGVAVTYHETQADAENDTNVLAIPYTNTVANAQTVFVRLEDDTTGCIDITTLDLVVNPSPIFTTITDIAVCDENNPGDNTEIFDLSTKDVEIINGQVNVSIAYYENQADADAGINAITGPYSNTGSPQTIIVVLENTLTGCSNSSQFDIVVNPAPTVVLPTPLEECDDDMADGFTSFTLSDKTVEILGGQTGV
ncbi:MAG: choice-of-anchor L domain-containing protein, partial [Bacteroidota bacterium]